MNDKNPVKVLKTAVFVSKTLETLCAFSTAFTAVTAIWAVLRAVKKISV